jgi:hypothetical protein
MSAFVRTAKASCPVCGADLEKMTGSQCPDCQTELMLAVVTNQPRAGLWLLATILLFINAGIGMLFGLALIGSIMQKESLPPSYHYNFIWFYIACIPIAILFLLTRRPFIRLAAGLQLVGVLVVCAVTVGGFVWMFLSK